MVPSHAAHSDLNEYVRVLRRRKWIMVMSVLLVTGSALGVSALQTPIYEGTAEVLLQPGSTSELLLFQDEQRARVVETEIRVLKSKPVRDAVSEQLSIPPPPVSAKVIPETEAFLVSARHVDPVVAADIANGYANAYIEYRRSQAVEDLVAAGAGLQTQIGALQEQIDGLAAEISSASEEGRGSAEQNLASQRDALVAQQALLKQSLDKLQVSTSLITGGAQLVNPAVPTDDPVEPRLLRNSILGVGLGLLLGISLALILDRLDDTIKSKDDLGRAAPRIPVIGLIPMVSGWRRKGDARLISRSSPNSPAAEAYRSLRTSISFLGVDRNVRVLQITSPSASEGKSTTVANLALALARSGKRVIILSSDLRRPRVHEFFELSNEIGFTTVLIGEASVSEVLQEVPGEDNLAVLASGPVPSNPSELLSSNRTVEVLTVLQSRADIVLIDSAPVLPVTDSAVLASHGYPTLLIASAGTTTRKRMARAIELLNQVNGVIVGAVLNEVGQDDEMGYGYGYRYEQGSEKGTHFRRRPKSAPTMATRASPSRSEHTMFPDIEGHGPAARNGEVQVEEAGSTVPRRGQGR